MDLAQVFSCRRCGACCKGQGGIYLRSDQVEAAARGLGLAPEEFRRRYTKAQHGLLALKTGPEGYCLLREPESGACLIHEAKPAMCRAWPFFSGPLASPEGFTPVKNACPGIHPEATWEDFVAYHRAFIQTEPPRSHLFQLQSENLSEK